MLRADLNVHVASTSTSPGNPALLRCEVSKAAREYVRVKEWTRDGAKVTLHDFRPVGHRGKTWVNDRSTIRNRHDMCISSVWVSLVLKWMHHLVVAYSVDRYLGLARMWTALSRHIGFASRMRSPMCGKKGEGGRAKAKGKAR